MRATLAGVLSCSLGVVELPDVDVDPVSRHEGDAPELLRELVSHRLPAAVLREARAAGAERAAVYVVDIDGSGLIKLDGDELFPEHIQAQLAVGPELPPERLGEITDIVSSKVPDASVMALSVRDRAVGVLVTCGRSTDVHRRLAERAALALELGSGYTDVIHRARRRKEINAAAEIQQNLLPPRIATVEGAHIAGGVLPGYEVGGDFFDYRSRSDLRARRRLSIPDCRARRVAPREAYSGLDQLRPPQAPARGSQRRRLGTRR